MIYRKMIEKPEVEQRFVANILRKAPDELGQQHPNIKLNLFETNSGLQEVFVFNDSDVLSSDQIEKLKDPRADKSLLFKQAVDSRLRVKELQRNHIGMVEDETRFVAFFVNPALI